MRIVLRYNPLAGRGRAAAIADAAESRLARDGHQLRRVPVSKSDPAALGRALDGRGDEHAGGPADLLVIIGGDGTVHHALPDVLARGTPVYHLPLGTENLFARQFGMPLDVDRLAAAAQRPEVTRVDAGVCNGAPFALMCSVGPDANVVHRLARTRRGRISHLSYLAPALAEVLRPRFPLLRLAVDGRTVVDGRRGLLVVANSRQYALRIDPAARAGITDGLLDAVFFPASTSLRVLAWALSSRLRRHLANPNLIYTTGAHVRAENLDPTAGDTGALYQIDGEPSTRPTTTAPTPTAILDCRIHPRPLHILTPLPPPPLSPKS